MDSIPLGVDFRIYLDEQVAKCEVFLAVIGRDWMQSLGSTGRTRLDNPGDYVRIEIESALKRQIPVVPVLVGGALIPRAEQLPVSIQELSYRNGIAVRVDPDFHRDMDRLIDQLKKDPPWRIRRVTLTESGESQATHSCSTNHITRQSTATRNPFRNGEGPERAVPIRGGQNP